MDAKKWIIFAVVAVLTLGALVYFSGSSSLDVSDVDANSIIESEERNGNIGDHVYGDRNSPVILVEYGDFQCPGCRAAHPQVQLVKEEYGEHIAFIYRHLPLTQNHPNARAAASAAEAAGKQDAFWDYHDLLFDNQTAWSGASSADRGDIFRSYAMELGLDIDQWDEDYNSENVAQKVSFDLALAREVGASSTPTFILNGETMEQGIHGDSDAFLEAIREAILAAGIELDEEETEE